ncbi:MAG: hypothetical protein AB7K09_02040 [Planctomycetota bacterium]
MIWTTEHQMACAFSANGALVVSTDWDGRLSALDVRNGKTRSVCEFRFIADCDRFLGPCVALPIQSTVACVSETGNVLLFRMPDWLPVGLLFSAVGIKSSDRVVDLMTLDKGRILTVHPGGRLGVWEHDWGADLQ